MTFSKIFFERKILHSGWNWLKHVSEEPSQHCLYQWWSNSVILYKDYDARSRYIVSRAWIRNCIPQNTVGGNYSSMPKKLAKDVYGVLLNNCMLWTVCVTNCMYVLQLVSRSFNEQACWYKKYQLITWYKVHQLWIKLFKYFSFIEVFHKNCFEI